jgi:hypothetical protein
MLEITPDHIAELADDDLRTLIGLLVKPNWQGIIFLSPLSHGAVINGRRMADLTSG